MSSLPKRFTPLVLKPRAEAFDNPAWLFDLNYDGFRALLEINGNEARSHRPRRSASHLLRCSVVLSADIDKPTGAPPSREQPSFETTCRRCDMLIASIAKRICRSDSICRGER